VLFLYGADQRPGVAPSKRHHEESTLTNDGPSRPCLQPAETRVRIRPVMSSHPSRT
jgi:hypothetical protein